MGYFKRLADKRYRIVYDDVPCNGKRRQKTETLEGVSKKEADSKLNARETEVRKRREAIESGEQVKDEVMLSELFENFYFKSARRRKATRFDVTTRSPSSTSNLSSAISRRGNYGRTIL